jgi:hypothetical protein
MYVNVETNMKDMDLIDDDLITNKVKIILNMICALMLDKVSGEVYCADDDVVIVDKRASV